MPHAAFFRLLQATEAQRKCEGLDCIPIADHHVDIAERNEAEQASHEADHAPSENGAHDCPECERIRQNIIALREVLHSEGIDFPVEVMS